MMAAAVDMHVQGELRYDEPMSRHTSWRAGGPAETFFVPASIDDLSSFLAGLDEDTPVFWHGVGSNLLVRDGGLRGVVVSATKMLRQLEREDQYAVRAGAGVPCTQLARQCIRWGLGPSEFFAGIPGSVGGALAMNAGAHGGETWERVESVRTIDRAGEIHERSPAEYTVAYRSVTGPADEWFIEGTFGFEPDDVQRDARQEQHDEEYEQPEDDQRAFFVIPIPPPCRPQADRRPLGTNSVPCLIQCNLHSHNHPSRRRRLQTHRDK